MAGWLDEDQATSKSIRGFFIRDYYAEFKQVHKHYKMNGYKEARKSRWLIERRHADKVRHHGLRRSRYPGLERTYIHKIVAATRRQLSDTCLCISVRMRPSFEGS